MKKYWKLLVAMAIIAAMSYTLGTVSHAAPAVSDATGDESAVDTVVTGKDGENDADENVTVGEDAGNNDANETDGADENDHTDENDDTDEDVTVGEDDDTDDTSETNNASESDAGKQDAAKADTSNNAGKTDDANNSSDASNSSNAGKTGDSSKDTTSDTSSSASTTITIVQPQAYTKADGEAVMVNADGSEQLLGIWLGDKFFAAKSQDSAGPAISQATGENGETIYGLDGVTFIQEAGAPSMEPLMRYYSTLWVCGATSQCFSTSWTYRSMLSTDGVPGMVIDFENRELRFIEVDLGSFISEGGYETLQVTAQ